MQELTDPTKFNLPYGRLVVAKVQAQNSAGWGQLSDSNTAGASTEVVPMAVQGLSRGPLTSETQSEIQWTALATISEVGGATCSIISYRVQWDQGIGGEDSWVDLAGVASQYTDLSFL